MMNGKTSTRPIVAMVSIWGIPVFVWLLAQLLVVLWAWQPGQKHPYWGEQLVVIAVGCAAALWGVRSQSKTSLKRAAVPVVVASVGVGVVFARGYPVGFVGEGFVVGAILAAVIQSFGLAIGFGIGWAWRKFYHRSGPKPGASRE